MLVNRSTRRNRDPWRRGGGIAGATAAVAFDPKTSCCGGPVSVMSPERSPHLIEEILQAAQDAEADAALQRTTIRSKELDGLAKE